MPCDNCPLTRSKLRIWSRDISTESDSSAYYRLKSYTWQTSRDSVFKADLLSIEIFHRTNQSFNESEKLKRYSGYSDFFFDSKCLKTLFLSCLASISSKPFQIHSLMQSYFKRKVVCLEIQKVIMNSKVQSDQYHKNIMTVRSGCAVTST